jgi:hypothetical protein
MLMVICLLLSIAKSYADSSEISVKNFHIPSGTKIRVISKTDIMGGGVSNNSPFSVTLVEDLTSESRVALPQGTRIDGIINVSSNEAGTLKKVLLLFQTVEGPAAQKLPISAEAVNRGGVLHLKRGLIDIPLSVEFAQLGGGVSSSGSRKIQVVKRVRPTLAVGKSSDVHRIEDVDVPRDQHVRLISYKTIPVAIRKGDEFKIELPKDLILLVLPNTTEKQ